jgi:hypothetical protein
MIETTFWQNVLALYFTSGVTNSLQVILLLLTLTFC